LIIAGESKKGSERYWLDIQKTIEDGPCSGQIIQRIEFVPDEQTELYFKAADITVLPYTEVFQSGVLFLAYSFGLPVIASDVGSSATISFREEQVFFVPHAKPQTCPLPSRPTLPAICSRTLITVDRRSKILPIHATPGM